ncbi:hypothetical protein A2U01_0045993, partial [Trifolium medium]|nr:hypothetical protein [Trifolium medium]
VSPRSAGSPAIRFLIGPSTIYIRVPGLTVMDARGVLRSLSSTIYIRTPSPTVLGVRGCVKKSDTGCEIA